MRFSCGVLRRLRCRHRRFMILGFPKLRAFVRRCSLSLRRRIGVLRILRVLRCLMMRGLLRSSSTCALIRASTARRPRNCSRAIGVSVRKWIRIFRNSLRHAPASPMAFVRSRNSWRLRRRLRTTSKAVRSAANLDGSMPTRIDSTCVRRMRSCRSLCMKRCLGITFRFRLRMNSKACASFGRTLIPLRSSKVGRSTASDLELRWGSMQILTMTSADSSTKCGGRRDSL